MSPHWRRIEPGKREEQEAVKKERFHEEPRSVTRTYIDTYICMCRYTYSLLKFGYLSRCTARPLSIFYIREDFELCDCRKSKLLPRRSSSSPCESASFFSWKCARASFFGFRESARKPMGSLLREISDEVIKYGAFHSDGETVTRKSFVKFSIPIYARRFRSIDALSYDLYKRSIVVSVRRHSYKIIYSRSCISRIS